MYNNYFIIIGKNVSTNLNGNISYKNYLKMPSKTTCHLEKVTTSDVENIIDKFLKISQARVMMEYRIPFLNPLNQ